MQTSVNLECKYIISLQEYNLCCSSTLIHEEVENKINITSVVLSYWSSKRFMDSIFPMTFVKILTSNDLFLKIPWNTQFEGCHELPPGC